MVDISGIYVTDFICTYHLMENLTDTDLLYKTQLLQAFNLEKFDDDRINTSTNFLYEKYGNNKYIKVILDADILKIKPIINDPLTHFRLYFGYETFHLLHNLLCSIINKTQINKINYSKLIK